MSRRDFGFSGAFALITAALFLPLILHPSLIPGNFGDLYSYHYPLRHLVAATLQEGRLPLWNPYIFAGTPLAANPQAALFYPVSLLHYFFPLAWSFSANSFLHVLLAGIGAQLLLRKARIDSTGAALLSAAYGLSPFLVLRIAQGIPTHLDALAWAPWVWLAALSSNPIWLGLTLAMQGLSGHPQFSLLNLIALALFLLCRRPARLIPLAQAGAFALLLSAAQAFPTLEFLRRSVRSIWNPVLATGYSLTPAYLLTYLYPNWFGNPMKAGFSLFPSEFFEMLTGYIGLIPLAFGVIGLPRARPSWLLIAAGLFFAAGTSNPLYAPLQRILGLDFLRTPSRFAFIALLGLWLAAGEGWKQARPRVKPALAALFLLITLGDLAAWTHPWIYAQDPKRFLSSNPGAVTALRQGGGRFATDPDNLTPNKSMQYRLLNATGYEAFYLAPIAEYTARSERGPAADGSRTYIRDWTTPEMSKLAVTRYVTTDGAARGRAPIWHEGAAFIYANPGALPLVQRADAWAMPRPEHWVVRLDHPASPLISQSVYSGWKAWANGHRVATRVEDGIFPRVEDPSAAGIPGPPWVIHFRFLPESWFVGVLISLMTLVTASWAALVRIRRPS